MQTNHEITKGWFRSLDPKLPRKLRRQVARGLRKVYKVPVEVMFPKQELEGEQVEPERVG